MEWNLLHFHHTIFKHHTALLYSLAPKYLPSPEIQNSYAFKVLLTALGFVFFFSLLHKTAHSALFH